MWKFQKEEEKPRPSAAPAKPAVPPQPVATPAPLRTAEPVRVAEPVRTAQASSIAHIGKSVFIKGQLTGSEDLYLDGEVEGSIELPGSVLTIGPNGRIRANVTAKEIIVRGKVNGNLFGVEKVELRNTAVLVGDIATKRIVMEEGAFFKGGIDIQRAEAKPETRAASSAGTNAQPSAPQAPVIQK